jgi:hypothetical protein
MAKTKENLQLEKWNTFLTAECQPPIILDLFDRSQLKSEHLKIYLPLEIRGRF